MSSLRASQLSGSTAVNSASTTSLASMGSSTTITTPANAVVATANIINQRADASRSLYQICVALKQRLATVPDFEDYLQVLDRDAMSSEYNPVESLWGLLRSGDPLLTIYNSTKPDVPLNPAELPSDPTRRAKAATFKFINACLRQILIPAAECFIVSDLMREDTTGFVKVIQVINHVLDIAQQGGYLLQVAPYPEDGSFEGPTAQMTYRDHIIRELVDTERKYVQDMENLHDLKKTLLDKAVIPGDVAYQIFLNLNGILDFQRRFLIRVETTNSMPQSAQQWGSIFVMNEEGFEIYQQFIANQRKAAQVANQVFDKIQFAEHPVACDFNTLDGFLLKPMQRLAKYPLLLKDLLKRGEVPPENHDELTRGIEAAERVLKQANEAVNRALLREALEELRARVDDWNSHRVDHFGELLLHGSYQVITGRSEQEKDYEIYLFENILLCCKEAQANKSKDKKDKNKSISKGRNKSSKLQLKGRIFMSNVTEVISFAKPGSYTIQIWWKGDPGVENFIIKYNNEEIMKKWATGLDVQRKINIPQSSATSPEQATPGFTWMRNVDNIENPYAEKDDDDDDDDEQPIPSQMSSPNPGYSSNMGGVMAHNGSSSSLRARSVTTDSTQSLASLARAPPPQFPLPLAPRQLSVQTGSAQPPLPRGGESYFSPTVDSPASSRTSTASTLLSQNGQYPFPRTSTPQGGWEDRDTNRYTAPAMPRAPSRDGSTPVNGRNPRGPSMPVMASQQTLAQQQRSRSYSTPDINGQNTRRANTTTPVPAVPGIPPHLHPAHDSNIPRSQTGSPRQDPPVRANTQSPGVQRERLNQQNGQYGATMSQFPTQPIYPRQATPSMGQAPGSTVSQPLSLDGRQVVSSALGNAAAVNAASNQDLPIPTQLRVRVNCDTGTYVTLVVPFSITYQSLSDRIDGKLARFTTSSISKGNLRLKYRDEDGDLVTIESDDDIQIAFLEWREGASNMYTNGVGEIELFCVGDMN
ncbi:Rho guanyl nucleotide exchange factor [Xylaria bambusicola]|uniref:Rho guanyl nucleotide exchange factor n=1 Tax=Xylaria bambusicola TaxID=326684 RepID=UPI002007B407|nr:Rho guanyl nucleotide exchange factor [Xylaria bambusicola]KAI0505334.1 Rho guanyl nucleotide exchange factor [Xylaria bambusicola]